MEDPDAYAKHVRIVRELFLRLTELNAQIKERVNRNVGEAANMALPMPSQTGGQPASAAPATRNPEYSRCTDWPACVNVCPNWAALFRISGEGEGAWLTPRMAHKIFHAAVEGGGMDINADSPPRLPKVARLFWGRSKDWRRNFRECYRQIACRVAQGRLPRPNCTGEEMALHNLLDSAEDMGNDILDHDPHAARLPRFPEKDDDFGMVRDVAVEDLDVLELFDEDYDSDEEVAAGVDDRLISPHSVASFMLGSGGDMMGAANLHPADWFVAFKVSNMQDHL